MPIGTPLAILGTALYLLTRDDTDKFLGEVLGNGNRRSQQQQKLPTLTPAQAGRVAYVSADARYFRRDVCRDLFEQMKQQTIEGVKVAGRAAPPGLFALVPISQRPGAVSVARAIMAAHKEGLHTALSLSATIPGAPRLLMFCNDPRVAHAGSQWAIVGPLGGTTKNASSSASVSGDPSTATAPPAPSASATTATLESELARIAADGLPIVIVRNALEHEQIEPEVLENAARELSDYPIVKAALARRAGVLRAKRGLEGTSATTTPRSRSNGTNGKHRPVTIIEAPAVEATEETKS